MAIFLPLFSSSSGNSVYVGSRTSGVLIDTGRSAKQIEKALCQHELGTEQIRAIFITHEHSDHIKGLKVFAGRHKIPVFASEGTLEKMRMMQAFDDRTTADVIPYDGMEIGGMFVKPFRTPHDAAESTGYVIHTADDRKAAVCTDLGAVTEEVREQITGCDLILLESNHEVGMLMNGPYPYFLKRRILSDRGHLSNASCAEEVVRLIDKGTVHFVLGHLSGENNMPNIALSASVAALDQVGAKFGVDYTMQVAGRETPEKVTVF